jgi:hypothetical protein
LIIRKEKREEKKPVAKMGSGPSPLEWRLQKPKTESNYYLKN